MGSSSGSDSEGSRGGYSKGHKIKVKKDKKDKDKDKHKEGKKDKDKDKHKEGKKDKDKDKHKKDKKDKYEIPGIGKLPGPAGALLGAALSSLGGSGKREASPGGHPSGSSDRYQTPQHQLPVHGQPPLMPMYTDYHSSPSHTAAAGHLDPSQLPPYARLLSTHNPLPPPNEVGYAACTDIGGEPLFLVLVPQGGGLHPGKMVIRHGSSHGEIYVSYDGREVAYSGDFALVPFDPQRMHWVPSPRGVLPPGPRPVDGGREADGTPLYFALGFVNGGRVPGKAGHHLGGASVPFGGEEVGSEHAEILCWL